MRLVSVMVEVVAVDKRREEGGGSRGRGGS